MSSEHFLNALVARSQSSSVPMDFSGLVLSSIVYSKPNIPITSPNKVDDSEDLVIELLGSAQNVGVILSELSDSEQTVKHTALFVPMDGSKLEISQRKIAI